MNMFPIIITEVNNGEVKKTHAELYSNKPINTASDRSPVISRYVDENLGDYEQSLCGDCARTVRECPKLRDRSKNFIQNYKFIQKGFQVQDQYMDLNDETRFNDDMACKDDEIGMRNSLRIDRFVVTKCKGYKNGRTRR